MKEQSHGNPLDVTRKQNPCYRMKLPESQFTKIIRTRIVGEARRTIQDQDFNSMAQLIKYLKQVYNASKNIY